MDWTEDDFEFLLASARRAIGQYRTELTRRGALSDQRRGAALRGRIRQDLDAYEQELRRRESQFRLIDVDVKSVTTEALREVNLEVGRLGSVVAWALSADRPDQKLAPVFFAEEAAAAILQRACEVVVVPSAETEYATPVPTATWKASASVDDNSPEPIVVFLPPSEHASGLLLPLLVHEVAHTAVAVHKLIGRTKDVYGEEWATAVSDVAGPLEADHGMTRRAALFTAEARFERFVKELLCDALATAYCGPSYLFAFSAVVLRRELGGMGEAHPPAVDRVAAMRDLLARLGWKGFGPDPDTRMGIWLRRVANAGLSGLSNFDQALLQEIPPLAVRIQELVLEHLGNASLSPDRLVAVDEISQLLKLGILPAQLAEDAPADRRAILHAAWEWTFSHEAPWGGDRPASLPRALDDTRFQDLVGRAVEMSFVAEAWSHAAPERT